MATPGTKEPDKSEPAKSGEVGGAQQLAATTAMAHERTNYDDKESKISEHRKAAGPEPEPAPAVEGEEESRPPDDADPA